MYIRLPEQDAFSQGEQKRPPDQSRCDIADLVSRASHDPTNRLDSRSFATLTPQVHFSTFFFVYGPRNLQAERLRDRIKPSDLALHRSVGNLTRGDRFGRWGRWTEKLEAALILGSIRRRRFRLLRRLLLPCRSSASGLMRKSSFRSLTAIDADRRARQ